MCVVRIALALGVALVPPLRISNARGDQLAISGPGGPVQDQFWRDRIRVDYEMPAGYAQIMFVTVPLPRN